MQGKNLKFCELRHPFWVNQQYSIALIRRSARYTGQDCYYTCAREDPILPDRMTDYLTLSQTTPHSAWLGLLLFVTTLFANAEAAMPPQLAVASVSVIDPITAEASLQPTTAEFYAGASIDEGISYVTCVDP